MRKLAVVSSSLLPLVLAAACSSSDPQPMTGDPDASVDPPGTDFVPLVEGDWNLAANDEGYFCVYATVPREMYISKWHPIAPLGTHHTVLTLYQGTQPDGIVPCSAGTNGQSMIYGSGIGAPDLAFPDGVGLKLSAGQRVLLNLHLYNTDDAPLSGHSGVTVLETTKDKVQHEAEVVLAGPTFSLTVPTGVSTQTGACNVSGFASEPVTVFSLSQHMHKRGRALKTTLTRGGVDTILQDEAYSFESQAFHSIDPVVLMPSDVITTACTYENADAPTGFGDSSDMEMCFSDLFYYPAQHSTFICTQ